MKNLLLKILQYILKVIAISFMIILAIIMILNLLNVPFPYHIPVK